MDKKRNKFVVPALVLAAAIVAVSAIGIMISNEIPNKPLNQFGQFPLAQVQQKLDFAGASENSNVPVPSTIISLAADSTTSQRLITVSGTSAQSVSPDNAVVAFSVRTLDKSASASQSKNAETMSKTIQALKNAGIMDKDLKTTGYSLNEEFQWNDTLKKSESVGYRTTNSIEATIRDLAKTGSVIDAGVSAGANSIDSVVFKLSDSQENTVKTALLKQAAMNAKSKAQSIADGLGVALGQVQSVNATESNTVPYYYASMAKDSSGSATQIMPSNVELSATITVQFQIQ